MLEILNASIVVTAEAHNPSILHPAFLEAQHIVPPDWVVAEPPLCTPALSVVKFANGTVISVDQQKLQIIDNSPPADPQESKLPGIVERYTATLPHVRYRGVGVNLSGFIETADAYAILGQFLSPGKWNEGVLQPKAVGLRFVYSVIGHQLRLAIDGGAVQSASGATARNGIVIAANYHVDIAGDASTIQVGEATKRFATCFENFREIVPTIVQQQGSHVTH